MTSRKTTDKCLLPKIKFLLSSETRIWKTCVCHYERGSSGRPRLSEKAVTVLPFPVPVCGRLSGRLHKLWRNPLQRRFLSSLPLTYLLNHLFISVWTHGYFILCFGLRLTRSDAITTQYCSSKVLCFPEFY